MTIRLFARRRLGLVVISTLSVLPMVDVGSAAASRIDRLGGLDRYETATRVAQRVEDEGRAGDTVLLTTGENFPDAVSAGGWRGDGVILLTKRTSIPSTTLEALADSRFRKVYVVGGPAAVDDVVLDRVRALGKSVERLWGSDRHATSIAVSKASVPEVSVNSVWIAPGTSFADQLVAAAGARRADGAFLIVAPSRALSSTALAEIRRIATPGASLHVVDSASLLTAVTVDGLTRISHSGDVFTNSNATQAESTTTVVASGENWPDALGGTRLVTSSRGLVLSRPSCAPSDVAGRLQRASTLLVLGGTVALSDSSAEGVACESPGTSPPPSSTPSTPAPTASPLDGVRVEPEHLTGYDRDLFRHWIDSDRDGCDTRREVLILESTTPVQVGAGCSITGGTWFSVYDGTTTIDASTFDIDHMVPLKEAWDSGAHSWTSARREQFANDLALAESLIAVSASSNRSKSDRDPAEWMPTRSSYHCAYVIAWITVKKAWDLSVDQAEYQKLQQVLSTC